MVVSLVDGTTELAIGAHFANNIFGLLVVNAAGTVVATPALFIVSAFHSTFLALAVLVFVPLFLAISYGVFKRKPQTRLPAPPAESSATSSNAKPISNKIEGVNHHV